MDSFWITLLAALEVGYIDVNFMNQWADRLIAKTNCPKDWLIRISLSSTKEEIIKVLAEYVRYTPISIKGDIHKMEIGFYWLSYDRGNFTGCEFIYELFQSEDAGELGIFDLNRLHEISESMQPNERVSDKELLATVIPLGIKAKEHFLYLNSDVFFEREITNIEA